MLSLWLVVVEWDERNFKKLTKSPKKAFEKLKSKNRWDLAPTCLDISAPTLLKSTRRFCLYCKYFRITFGLRIANIQGCRSQWAGGDIATSELADQFTQGLLEIPTREGADYAHNITTRSPAFSDLPKALKDIRICMKDLYRALNELIGHTATLQCKPNTYLGSFIGVFLSITCLKVAT